MAQHHKDRLQKPIAGAAGGAVHNLQAEQTAPNAVAPVAAAQLPLPLQPNSAPPVTAAVLVASGNSWSTVGGESLDQQRSTDRENKRKDASPTNVYSGPGKTH